MPVMLCGFRDLEIENLTPVQNNESTRKHVYSDGIFSSLGAVRSEVIRDPY